MKSQCATCRHWLALTENDDTHGWCRRYAPRPRLGHEVGPLDAPGTEVWWPTTRRHDACSEWQAS